MYSKPCQQSGKKEFDLFNEISTFAEFGTPSNTVG